MNPLLTVDCAFLHCSVIKKMPHRYVQRQCDVVISQLRFLLSGCWQELISIPDFFICLYAFVEPVLWPGIRQVQENIRTWWMPLRLWSISDVARLGGMTAGGYIWQECVLRVSQKQKKSQLPSARRVLWRNTVQSISWVWGVPTAVHF